MQSKYLAAKDLPVFNGKETPKEQAQMIQQYLFRLREELVYILGNLGAENWNETALADMLNDSALGANMRELAEAVLQLNLSVEELRIDLDNLKAQIQNSTEEVTSE